MIVSSEIHLANRKVRQNLLLSPTLAVGPPAAICLQAIKSAKYCLVGIEVIERSVGVWTRDLLTNRKQLIAEHSLATSARSGLVLATRLLVFDQFATTTGGSLPLTDLTCRMGWSESYHEKVPVSRF